MLPFTSIRFQFSCEGVVRPAAWPSPGNLLEARNLGLHSKHAETLGCSPAMCVLTSPSDAFMAAIWKHCLGVGRVPFLCPSSHPWQFSGPQAHVSSHISSALPRFEDISWENDLLSHLGRLICSHQQLVWSKSMSVLEKSRGINICFGWSTSRSFGFLYLQSCLPDLLKTIMVFLMGNDHSKYLSSCTYVGKHLSFFFFPPDLILTTT